MIEQHAPETPRRRYVRKRCITLPLKATQPRLEPNAQYVGINSARGVAVHVGWLRSATLIFIEASLLAAIFTFIFAAEQPYKAFGLMVVICIAGLLASGTWMTIIARSGTWVDFDNRKLAEIELVGVALVKVFSDDEFRKIAGGWGAGRILWLFAWASVGL